MDERPKITISEQELSILSDPSPFLVHKRIKSLFTMQCTEIKDQIIAFNKKQAIQFPIEIDQTVGKISQGMKYKDLPYFVFDFPRHFSACQIFNFRLVLVWSKGFSFQFIQKDVEPQNIVVNEFIDQIEKLRLSIVGADLIWEHFSEGAITNKFEAILTDNTYKIYELHDIDCFNTIIEKYLDFYQRILTLIKIA